MFKLITSVVGCIFVATLFGEGEGEGEGLICYRCYDSFNNTLGIRSLRSDIYGEDFAPCDKNQNNWNIWLCPAGYSVCVIMSGRVKDHTEIIRSCGKRDICKTYRPPLDTSLETCRECDTTLCNDYLRLPVPTTSTSSAAYPSSTTTTPTNTTSTTTTTPATSTTTTTPATSTTTTTPTNTTSTTTTTPATTTTTTTTTPATTTTTTTTTPATSTTTTTPATSTTTPTTTTSTTTPTTTTSTTTTTTPYPPTPTPLPPPVNPKVLLNLKINIMVKVKKNPRIKKRTP